MKGNCNVIVGEFIYEDVCVSFLPLVEVPISHISAIQYQSIHHMNCIDSPLGFALRTKKTVLKLLYLYKYKQQNAF